MSFLLTPTAHGHESPVLGTLPLVSFDNTTRLAAVHCWPVLVTGTANYVPKANMQRATLTKLFLPPNLL